MVVLRDCAARDLWIDFFMIECWTVLSCGAAVKGRRLWLNVIYNFPIRDIRSYYFEERFINVFRVDNMNYRVRERLERVKGVCSA